MAGVLRRDNVIYGVDGRTPGAMRFWNGDGPIFGVFIRGVVPGGVEQERVMLNCCQERYAHRARQQSKTCNQLIFIRRAGRAPPALHRWTWGAEMRSWLRPPLFWVFHR